MTRFGNRRWYHAALLTLLSLSIFMMSTESRAEDPSDDTPYSVPEDTVQPVPDQKPVPQPPPKPSKRKDNRDRERKYFIPDTKRTDAGVFHVAFAAGGNFYIEPRLNLDSLPTGDYFKDFGFGGGVYFDYDYSEMSENIPLSLRGFFGYKYILSSVHVFTFDGVVRYMIKVSDASQFGIGLGISTAVWYRAVTDTSPTQSVTFLPSAILSAGFDFTPFMVDFKWLINRIGSNNTIMGWELYFGFRL